MFEVPDWDDTSSNNLSFTNVSRSPKKNNKKNKKTKTPEMPKQVVQAKPRFKAKTISTSKMKLLKQVQRSNKIENKQKYKKNNEKKQENYNLTKQRNSLINLIDNKKDLDNDIKIKNYESGKQDELVLEVKKQKLDTTQLNEKKQEKYNMLKQRNSLINVIDNKKDLDNDIKIKNYESDKLDELVLDVKKQKFDTTYKNDDNEEMLFQERPEKISKKKKKKLHSNETTNNTVIETSYKPQPDHEDPEPKDDNETQIIAKDRTTSIKTKKVKVKVKNDTGNVIESKGIRKNVKLKDLRKKEILKSVLQRNHINVSGSKLRNRMLDRLKAAQFRYLNEKLYTSSGSDAQKLFQGDPSAFQIYHEGYQQQVKKWPVKPLDVIVKRIQKMPQTHKIADMGCGEAELSKRVSQTVRSFDLVATVPGVEACDMARTPLLARSMDVAVYCLALMGTELTQYLLEANRVLKPGGHLLIAEVESRFDNIQAFTSDVQRLGFSLKKLDDTQKVFYFLEFTKLRDPPVKKAKLPVLTLKPCIYKKR
ncbi:jg16451 [Pararge aegeria aegeria]|uniref:Ribosomal RNA-processing protein 8 n=2 Tax=Pararge aegeria TaxID=116150 RepID=A0A8S4RHA0_9NEOP|nr:jg16451 [Pararge aegeria aegeria]